MGARKPNGSDHVHVGEAGEVGPPSPPILGGARTVSGRRWVPRVRRVIAKNLDQQTTGWERARPARPERWDSLMKAPGSIEPPVRQRCRTGRLTLVSLRTT